MFTMLFRQAGRTVVQQAPFLRRAISSRRGAVRKRFRQLEPAELQPTLRAADGGGPLYPKLNRALWFTAGATGLICGGTTIWQYENELALRKAIYNFSMFGRHPQKHYQETRSRLTEWWSTRKDGEKMFFGIFVANALVFLAWRVPGLQPLMVKHFTVNLFTKPIFAPMLLSTFSHQAPMHFLLNMYCLYTFSGFTSGVLGKEHFLALYLCSGLFGSLGSYIFKTYRLSGSMTLGASGAILGLLASTAVLAPNAQFSIIFLPFIKFSAQNCLYGILAFDAAGLLLGWRTMDHAAHLGGTLFGCWYTLYGHRLIAQNRDLLLEKWSRIRSK